MSKNPRKRNSNAMFDFDPDLAYKKACEQKLDDKIWITTKMAEFAKVLFRNCSLAFYCFVTV